MHNHACTNYNFVLNLNNAAQYKHKIRNYLAFIGHVCYFLSGITTTSFLKMSTLRTLSRQFGGATMAAALFAMPMAANAEETIEVANTTTQLRETAYCAPLLPAQNGFIMNASASAHKYSKNNIGAVGISIFAGQDLGEHSPEFLGTVLVNSLRRRGVEAECFVHHKEMPNGTGINFHITGLSWGKDHSLSISESLNIETIEGVAAEAKTAGIILASNYTPDVANR